MAGAVVVLSEEGIYRGVTGGPGSAIEMPSLALNKGKGEFPVSLTILTYIRGLINTVNELLSLPRFIGPFITFISLALNQQAIIYGLFPPQVAWLYLPVAFSAANGLRPGLISAALVASYSIWLDPTDLQRTVIVPMSVLCLAALIGWQTRALREEQQRADVNQEKADIVDSANGNLKLALGAIDILDSLRFGWTAIPEDARLKMVETARGKLADLVTLHRSFRQMAQERGFVYSEDERDRLAGTLRVAGESEAE